MLFVCFFFSHLEPVIKFSEIKHSVQEPREPGETALVRIHVLRLGDSSKVSVVRVHTKDGSATSGEDYNPMSEGKGASLDVRIGNISLESAFPQMNAGQFDNKMVSSVL